MTISSIHKCFRSLSCSQRKHLLSDHIYRAIFSDERNVTVSRSKAMAEEQKNYEQYLQFLLTHSTNNGSNKMDPFKNPLIIRFDGCNFASFTKPFHKPFDPFLHKALVLAGEDLIKRYPLLTVYICSDELTAIFENYKEDEPSMFLGGRIQKIVSTCASFVSVRFQYHLRNLVEPIYMDEYDRVKYPRYYCDSMEQVKNFWHEKPYYMNLQETIEHSKDQMFSIFKSHQIRGPTDTSKSVISHLRENMSFFDARLILLPTTHHVLENILWRSRIDCLRNSKSLLARCYYTASKMHAIPSDLLIEKLEKEHGVSWHDMPNAFKYGTFIKKTSFLHTGINPKIGESVDTIRTKPESKSFLLKDFKDPHHPNTNLACEFLFAKRWNDISQDFWSECVDSL